MSAMTAASVTPEPAEPGVAIEPGLISDLARLTPQQLAAVTAVVRAMLPAERPAVASDLLGKYADGTCSISMEDIRAVRDQVAAEVEARMASEDWL